MGVRSSSHESLSLSLFHFLSLSFPLSLSLSFSHLASDNSNLGHGRLRVGVKKFRPVPNNASMFLKEKNKRNMGTERWRKLVLEKDNQQGRCEAKEKELVTEEG